MDDVNAIRIIRLVFPDVIIFGLSIFCFYIIRRSLRDLRRRESVELQISSTSNESNRPSSKTNRASLINRRKVLQRLLSMVRRMRLFIQFIIIGFAAFIYPSVLNSIYFVFFITVAFTWSLSVKFGKKFIFFRTLLVIYAGIHILTLYLYQFTFFQEALLPLSLWSK